MHHNVFEEDTKKILKTYKIERVEVEHLLQEKLLKDLRLLAVINDKGVVRTAEYKRFIKDLKKDIYFGLRKYFQEPVSASANFLELVKSHVSTKERLESLGEFNEIISKNIVKCEHIFDIGGGLYPLLFPFAKAINLKTYTWLDKNKQSFEILNSHKDALDKRLILFNDDIGEHGWDYYLPKDVEEFDVVIMLKLIPVIQRQQRELITSLLNVPAKTFLVTGSKYALTKNQSIEKREDKVIKDFIQASGKNVLGRLDTENEFGYFIG